MDKLMKMADQAASNTESLDESLTLCSDKFANFMKQNPIWSFYEITQSDYVAMSEAEKSRLIHDYYKFMSNGKRRSLFYFFCLTGQKKCMC